MLCVDQKILFWPGISLAPSKFKIQKIYTMLVLQNTGAESWHSEAEQEAEVKAEEEEEGLIWNRGKVQI